MAGAVEQLTRAEFSRFSDNPVACPLLRYKVESLADYFAVISSLVRKDDPYWFRGHLRVGWKLVPLALRYETKPQRERALSLISDFKRVTDIKLPRPPQPDEELKWVQICSALWAPHAIAGLDGKRDGSSVFCLRTERRRRRRLSVQSD